MKTKMLSVALVSAMLLATVSGCGGKSDDKTASKPASKAESTVSQKADEKKADDGKVDETSRESRANRNAAAFDKLTKLSDKTVNYKMVSVTEPNQIKYGDMEFYKQLEKRTNVHIDFDCYLGQTYGDQKNLMLSANNLPDAFIGSGSLSVDDVNKYGPMGMFLPLDDLIEKNAPNYKKMLADNKLVSGLSTSLDGKRYAFGSAIESDVRNFPDNLYINKTWLDKLGLAVPTTMDEFYDVLKAFKEKDPNGNSQADEVPLTFTKFNHITGYGSFFGAWGRVDVHNGSSVTALDHFVVEDEKAVFTADKDEYKNAVKGMKRFFTDGLFDQEGFVQEQSQYQAKMKSATPIIGAFYAWDTAAVDPANADQYIPITPLKATADAQPAHVKMRRNHINALGTGFTINANAKNPELLVKWIDNFYDKDISILAHQGPEYVIPDGNGKYTFDQTEPDGSEWKASYNAPLDGAPINFPATNYSDGIVPVSASEQVKTKLIEDVYKKQPIDMTLPNMIFTADEIKFNTASGMDIQNYVKERQSKWLLGEEDIDEGWSAYLDQLAKFNLPDYEKEIQTAYDRIMKK